MNKHIKEMAKDIRLNMQIQPNPKEHPSHQLARLLIEDGYRKASDVVEDVMKYLDDMGYLNIEPHAVNAVEAELKKKYIGEDTNVTTKESEGGE